MDELTPSHRYEEVQRPIPVWLPVVAALGLLCAVGSLIWAFVLQSRLATAEQNIAAAKQTSATLQNLGIEFATLGLIAGAVGLLFANVVSRLLLKRALHFDYHFQPGVTLFAWVLAGVLTVACGWMASYRVLGQKPLEVLREE